jgi:hypothetical protein
MAKAAVQSTQVVPGQSNAAISTRPTPLEALLRQLTGDLLDHSADGNVMDIVGRHQAQSAAHTLIQFPAAATGGVAYAVGGIDVAPVVGLLGFGNAAYGILRPGLGMTGQVITGGINGFVLGYIGAASADMFKPAANDGGSLGGDKSSIDGAPSPESVHN